MKVQITGIAASAIAFVAGLSASAEPITDAYDGSYEAKTELASYWRNAPSCKAGNAFQVNLVEGYFHSEPTGMASGFITSDGYFKGEFLVGDTELMPFEGTAEPDGRITGTAMKDDASCAWEVTLSPTSQND